MQHQANRDSGNRSRDYSPFAQEPLGGLLSGSAFYHPSLSRYEERVQEANIQSRNKWERTGRCRGSTPPPRVSLACVCSCGIHFRECGCFPDCFECRIRLFCLLPACFSLDDSRLLHHGVVPLFKVAGSADRGGGGGGGGGSSTVQFGAMGLGFSITKSRSPAAGIGPLSERNSGRTIFPSRKIEA